MDKHNHKEARKARILEHVIRSYVSSAVPVSSKMVANRMGSSISSATIRNIMGELEESGFIEQPHTSAGRVPTRAGYRRYVDIVCMDIQFEKKEAERLAGEYIQRIRTIQEVIEKTSFLISRELHNAGVVLWPSVEDSHLKHIELIQVNAEAVLAVLVTMTNAVKNYIIKLDHELQKIELEKITNYINQNYRHISFSGMSDDLRAEVKRENAGDMDIAKSALKFIDSIIEESIENEIHWDGLDYFINEPEFRDINVTRKIFQLFSDRNGLSGLMRNELPDVGFKVYIGEENPCDILKECSIVTCGYTLHGKTVGRIGVIGPTRMDYDHALRTLNCLSSLISHELEAI
ncbi:MAG: heat-inducible transcriptional repressor HrcA [Candidatus Omnitrophota bacterium]